MNKSLIFRILGALASALIVVAVFLPFYMVDGYSESLWFSASQVDSLFLPILIIIFGMIGVIFFALNFKTEFTYTSCGAITFYVVMTTIDYINQDKFSTLSVGYYCLLIGAILIGIMAFITNKKSKIKVIEPINETPKEQLGLNQVNGVNNSVNIMTAQSLTTPMQPIQSNENLDAIPELTQEKNINQIPDIQPIHNDTLNSPIPEPNPVLEQFNTEMPSIGPVEPLVQSQPNPVLEQFNTGMPSIEPVQTPVQSQPNPVLEQFNTGVPSNQPQEQSLFSFGGDIENRQPQPGSAVPLSNINDNANQGLQTPNTTGLDIFGQPINK